MHHQLILCRDMIQITCRHPSFASASMACSVWYPASGCMKTSLSQERWKLSLFPKVYILGSCASRSAAILAVASLLNLSSMFAPVHKLVPVALTLLASLQSADAASIKHNPRQVPANATGVTTITSPAGVRMRYKEPGNDGFCETTPGVKSYSGYIDLAPDEHTFFYFFEARSNPATAPVTLWLNGGPGSSSLIGLFQGTGPTIPVFPESR